MSDFLKENIFWIREPQNGSGKHMNKFEFNDGVYERK